MIASGSGYTTLPTATYYWYRYRIESQTNRTLVVIRRCTGFRQQEMVRSY